MDASTTTAPPALRVAGLSKTFAGTYALRDFNFEVAVGEVHALLGGNGSGKSTFIKMLSGYHRPDSGGEVFISGKQLNVGSADDAAALGCRFVHQDLGLVDTLSITDNILIGADFPSRFGTVLGKEARGIATSALQRISLNLDPDRLVATLTASQRTGVAIARAIGTAQPGEISLLVLDEPTASLPPDEVDTLLALVRRASDAGVAVIYVTHRIGEVFQVADNVSVLRDGITVARRKVAALDRPALLQLLTEAEGDVPVEAPAIPLEFLDAPPLMTVNGVGSGSLASMTIEACPGEVVGIAGITGSGRESALGAIFGALERSGTVSVGGKQLRPLRPADAMALGMAYVPPDRHAAGGIMSLTARENLSIGDLASIWRAPFVRRRKERELASESFRRLDVRPAEDIERKLELFSGGNQQKVVIAKWLRRNPKVFLLDEPTQGVDVAARARIHEEIVGVARSGAAVLVASADVDELVAISDRVLVLAEGRLACALAGDDINVGEIGKQMQKSWKEASA
ncbi:sugar ABC transporter ATP-binding protein [Nocardioides sp. WS12]|uniref:sugar ABC transporter ATP-binding protein n=1 Tax=Nocardioides sp. WS12 TaxID=2486272 RepID=UPI0015FAA3B2|nr:sugar ABC transporter ATP-binding protein [Nocardioides sp. WS12]